MKKIVRNVLVLLLIVVFGIPAANSANTLDNVKKKRKEALWNQPS